MKDYYLLIGLNSKEIKILDVNQRGNGLIELDIENRKKKVRCPICNKFTSSVHGKLKPIKSVYLDSCGSKVDLIIHKKRYHCYNCNKIFTEELNINTSKGNISNKVKIQIRKDLLNYNLSLKYIAEKNRVSITFVENEMLDIISGMPKYIVNLPIDILDDILKISNDLMEGYYLKEEFLDIIHHPNQMNVETQINKWISKCIEKNIPEFIETAKTISRWKEYILNSFIDERYSNGYTEGTNNKIKVIKRIAFGYKSFELFRGRILYIFNGKISGSIKHKNDSKVKK